MIYKTYKSQALRNCLYLVAGAAVVALTVSFFTQMTTFLQIICVILSIVAVILFALSFTGLITRRSPSAILVFLLFKVIPIKDRRDPEVFKSYMESSSKNYEMSPKLAKKYDIKPFDDYTDTFVINRQRNKNDLIVFYIHGGGYWVRPYGIHFTMFNKLAEMLHAKFVIPIYPLAPAHNAKEANKMVLDRYLHLIHEDGADPKKIIFMGDSAGAGLALSLMLQLKAKKEPLPREAILFSPWVDATNSTPGMDKIIDPFLNLPNLTYGGEIYADDLKGGPAHPLCSPINGDLKGLPKITAFGGTYDSLNLDAMRFSDVAKEQGVDYTIYVYPKMIHGYAGFFFTPEAKYATSQVYNVIHHKPVENVVGEMKYEVQKS